MTDDISVKTDPILLLQEWLSRAKGLQGVREANAMTLSTVNKSGFVSSRVVLLKGLDSTGLTFFTNYLSQKSQEISEHSLVAANFYWDPWARQVRIEGRVQKTSRQESEEYWSTRPRDSQLGGYISQQSSILDSRPHLLSLLESARAQFEGRSVPCPEHWGGFRIIPIKFEFWIGRENRLHDRLCFQRANDQWQFSRLYP